MIILDTNILSELMKRHPSDRVIHWLDKQNTSDLFLTSITLAEIQFGIGNMPDGKRKQTFQTQFNRFIQHGFYARVLDFNQASALCYGTIMTNRKKLGRPMSMADGQIAAITSIHRLTLATRYIKDFECCGLELLNPFTL